MKIMRTLFVIMIFTNLVTGQSKTEDAKEELDTNKPATKSTSRSDNRDRDDSCMGSLLDAMGKLVFQVCINYDYDNMSAIQPILYNYPYDSTDITGLRSRFSGGSSLFQTTLAFGSGFEDAISNFTAKSDWHLSGWAIRFKYQYLQEQGAPYPIHYYYALVERKSVSFKDWDMGISTGLGQLDMDGKRFPGLLFGYNIEIFIRKPVSLFIQPSIFFPINADDIVLDRNLGLRYHHNTNYLEVRWNRFSIAAIPFYNIQIALGKYFK